jgi:uncharacterized protein YdeI (BOF family)
MKTIRRFKMKRTGRQIFFIFLLVATLATMGAAQGMNNRERTPFTGTEFMGAVIDPGKITQANGKVHIEGMVQLAKEVTTDPRTSGDSTIEINAVLDAKTFAGRMWGTFTIKNSEGEWTGSWTGRKTAKGYSFIQAQGDGKGGYAGLDAKWHYTRLSPDPMGPMEIRGILFEKGN